MKKINISTPTYPDIFAIVDDEDYDFLNQWKWYPAKRKWTSYVHRKEGEKTITIQSAILKRHFGNLNQKLLTI